ncbi:UDP-2,4-diacetamido-2,4,6-trideoxy-beta-L-altropyranose hydrolase [Winogradskyella sp. PE311]|uniref:UDP-2,4-diacetamido-2,4, 6-trideoxy-beta-L-altropyranose hydrolase n=1 Tax=Winogradskyella sp. PE311 TaxID=3366943 RepID=UPI00397EDBE1
MTKKIIFRADGNSSTGLGHLYRLFSLVEIVKNEIEFIFLTQETSTDSIIPDDYEKKVIPRKITIVKEAEWIASNFSSDNYIIIADGYQFNSNYQKQIKQKHFRLIYIDDLANEHMYADVVINHSPYINSKDYSKENYTKLALGTKYALLRPLFLEETKQTRVINHLDKAFVCFGGADPFNLSLKAVQAMVPMNEFIELHVVLGGAYRHKEIFTLESKYPDKIKTYSNLSEAELIQVMRTCNFAIAPASTILYELSCVKMPILSGYFVDNQELIYKGFKDSEAIYQGKSMRDYDVSDFTSQIEKILNDRRFNDKIRSQRALFDEKITTRHLKIIKETALTIGILCSGGLGLDTLSKISVDYKIQFILTDSKSISIIEFAKKNSIPVFAGNPRNGKGYDFIKDFNTDIIASINYLFLIDEDIIEHAKLLTFNIHGSLLPKYRGRTPHVWAIINGEEKAGITAHIIDKGCDTGKIIEQIEVPINFENTGADILEKYAEAYYPLVKKVLTSTLSNRLEFKIQNEKDASYFGKRTPADGEIDWNLTKEDIRNWVRAQANPYPGAFTFNNNRKIIIDKVSFYNAIEISNYSNGEIIKAQPFVVVKTKNGALKLDNIRTEKCTFVKGNVLGNENRK